MVDWDRVERLRAKGWDWDRIASDERAQFVSEASGGDPGRQLRTLYYQRRSKAQRQGSSGKLVKQGEDADAVDRPPALLRVGYLIVPLFGIWALLAYIFPSPVGVYIPWLYVALGLVVAAAVLLFALFRAQIRWERPLRTPLAVGIAIGLVVPAMFAIVGTAEGCPTLTSTAAANEPLNWTRYADPAWTIDGAPVFFFWGSIACPYCSASSWSMDIALNDISAGNLTGTSLGHSSTTDVFPSTPEVDLSSATTVSPYVNLQILEGIDDTKITTPGLPTCHHQSYVSTYDPGGSIPFVVIGGQYVHSGASLVDPQVMVNSSTGQAYTAQEVQAQIQAQNGPIWNAVAPQAYLMEAMLVKLNGGHAPAGVLNDPHVKSYLAQLH